MAMRRILPMERESRGQSVDRPMRPTTQLIDTLRGKGHYFPYPVNMES